LEQRKIGKSGLEASIVGLGCNNFGWRCDATQTKAVVDAAIDNGVTFFDTADMYGDGASEELLGAALGTKRAQCIVATKFGGTKGASGNTKGASRAWIMQAVDESLQRMNTDYIDLYQVHFPDRETPWEETMSALDELVEVGKIRTTGVSNVTSEDLQQTAAIAASSGQTPFTCCQSEYSLLVRDVEKEILPALLKLKMGFLPYFPLASGMLTGKYAGGVPKGARLENAQEYFDRFTDERARKVAARAASFAADRGRSPLELAFGWLTSHTAVTSVIAGATSPEQIAQNAKAADWRLSPDDMTELEGHLVADN
jgi:aryl-alcohol dehydrogenase-like predicted oxidoreductase